MVDGGKIKIKKKIYKFEFKHKYDYVNHYKVLERPPIERIKDVLKSLTGPPKKKEKKIEKAAPQPGGFNFVVFGAALLIGIIILTLGWLFLVTQGGVTAGLEPKPEKPIIDNTITESVIMTSGELGQSLYTAGVFIEYDTTNLENYTISLTPYQSRIPSEVFILSVAEPFDATTYSQFIGELRADLSTRNILLNEISMDELETMPDGAIVIIPSGRIPQEIIGIDSLIDPNKLVNRGVVVIYIGQPFTEHLTETGGSASTSEEILKDLPIGFDQTTSLSSSGGFHLFQPRYRAVGKGANWKSDLAYGSVSILTKGDGAFIFLPQTLDSGWRRNYTEAADDVSRIIFETPWADPIGETNSYGFVNQIDYEGSRFFFTKPFPSPKGTIKVDFLGYSNTTNFPIRESLYTYVEKPTENELHIEGGIKLVPTNITGDYARLNALLYEENPAQPEMFLIIKDSNNTQVETFAQGAVDVQGERSFDIPIYIDRGEYIISLADGFGKTYAQSYVKIVSIDIDYEGVLTRKPSVYRFSVTMDGSPVTLGNVTVAVDGGEFGRYNYRNVNFMEIDVGDRTGNQMLPFGNHSFEFTSGDLVVTVPVTHAQRYLIFTDPIFIAIVLLTGGIVGLGIMFARQERIFYSLDVPDFPPVTRTRIPLSADVVLSIFQKVNDSYRWKNTPLTPSEIKNGFKDIFYKGKPIFITDYNVEYLLEDLQKKGRVKGALGYYCLSEWTQKQSIDYLALMRRLRDICVNNAVPFTGMGESKDADSVITVVGQQMYLHFFDKHRDMQSMFDNIIRSINKGITIIVFKNEPEKEQFISLLDSSPSVAPLILKMESDSKALLFHTTDELVDMIVDFKSM